LSDGGISGQNVGAMGEGVAPHQRSDARRNRGRLLEAAAAVFAEQGLEAGVGEIAARAGVGRATLFRNFPCKQDLITAIVVERMREAIVAGHDLLEDGFDAEAPFVFMEAIVARQQIDRALFEAIDEEFLANPEIHAAHNDLIAIVDALLERGKQAGSVRRDVGALDVLMLVKGVCAAATALEPTPEMLARHLDLIRAAISTPDHSVPLRGRTPTLADLDAAIRPHRVRAE